MLTLRKKVPPPLLLGNRKYKCIYNDRREREKKRSKKIQFLLIAQKEKKKSIDEKGKTDKRKTSVKLEKGQQIMKE